MLVELRALIRAEDFRFAEAVQRLFHGLDAKIRMQYDGQAPGQDAATEPVDDGGEVDKAAGHRDVGDVPRPDLVGARHRQLSQQIRIDLVPWRRLRCVRLLVNRLDPMRFISVAT